MDAKPHLVVGTAGHIDHGKSRLVRVLTGIDPDRLPEEQARGMTIDLGFAHAEWDACTASFVDVPGHERFIRNMVAGATGIDVALLVIAADDSVMPQTREHAEVLALLGVDRLVVALTKMDLVDEEWADVVELEVRELLTTLGWPDAPIVRTSAETEAGIATLRDALAAAGLKPSRLAQPYAWFRLPVDRSFTVPGRGTVVTGTVAHGTVQRDAELTLWPDDRSVRVRDLQTHHTVRSAISGRRRLALNLAGIERDEVERGHTLATPGYLELSRYLDVQVLTLRVPGRTGRTRLRLRLHSATCELRCELRLLEATTDAAVSNQFAQLRVSAPLVATWGQRFILRDDAGQHTLGGGVILRPVARPWTARRPAHLAGLEILRDGKPAERLEEVIRAVEWRSPNERRLATRSGLADEGETLKLTAKLASAGRIRRFEAGTLRTYVHKTTLDAFIGDVNRRLQAYVRENPRLPGLARSQWPAWMPAACPARLRPALAEWLVSSGAVGTAHDHIVPAGEQQQQMSDADRELLAGILAQFRERAFQPPAVEELRGYHAKKDKQLRQLVQLAVARGELVRITANMWLAAEHWQALCRIVVDAIHARGGLTVADMRNLLGTSRKYMVPLAEALDTAGVTKRRGDVREVGPNADG